MGPPQRGGGGRGEGCRRRRLGEKEEEGAIAGIGVTGPMEEEASGNWKDRKNKIVRT